MGLKKHILIGTAAGLALLVVYAGVIALVQGWQHVLEQTASLWYWIAGLAIGFGIQAGLFSFIRSALRRRKASAAGMASSGGVSAGAMVACCAHHLGDVLPLVGIVGLAAFPVKYQLWFMVLGVLSNVIGITIMLETIQRNDLCPRLGNQVESRPYKAGNNRGGRGRPGFYCLAAGSGLRIRHRTIASRLERHIECHSEKLSAKESKTYEIISMLNMTGGETTCT